MESGLGQIAPVKNGVDQPKQCKCGSFDHLRISHRDCPLNKTSERTESFQHRKLINQDLYGIEVLAGGLKVHCPSTISLGGAGSGSSGGGGNSGSTNISSCIGGGGGGSNSQYLLPDEKKEIIRIEHKKARAAEKIHTMVRSMPAWRRDVFSEVSNCESIKRLRFKFTLCESADCLVGGAWTSVSCRMASLLW
jgi:hypothetical protein